MQEYERSERKRERCGLIGRARFVPQTQHSFRTAFFHARSKRMEPPDLRQRATDFLQKRYAGSALYSKPMELINSETGIVEKLIHVMAIYNTSSAVRQYALAIPNLGSHGEIPQLAATCKELFAMIKDFYIGFGGPRHRIAPAISSRQMIDSPLFIVYTDTLFSKHDEALAVFSDAGHLVEIIHEADMLDSLFISYGGPDEAMAERINSALKSQNVKTWFFPEDALPGQKLHRVMSDGVASHDRVLLVCSEASLARPGVLNELERVLEREASEGGSEILVPITLDDFVFSDWAPSRPDIARQVRARVIAKFPADAGSTEFTAAIKKVVNALRKK